MSIEKFTLGEWYLGNPFRYKDSKSEWCNLYADGEKNPIAVVLLNDGCGKTYHNATLIETASEMYQMLEQLHGVLASVPLLQGEIEAVLKKVRSEK